jgi:hypothetical protein
LEIRIVWKDDRGLRKDTEETRQFDDIPDLLDWLQENTDVNEGLQFENNNGKYTLTIFY